MRYRVVPLVPTLAVLLLSGCVGIAATPIRQYEQRQPIAARQGRSILVKRVVSSIEKGTEVGTVQAGLACVGKTKSTWMRPGELDTSAESNFTERARQEFRKIGYPIVGDPSDPTSLTGRQLFEGASTQADYQLAAIIKHLAWNVCYPNGSLGNSDSSGEASIEIEWQLYDAKTQSVVLSKTTGGAAKTSSMKRGGSEAIFGAFGASARNLMADSEFVSILNGSRSSQ
jgi:hypothetical protein